jgi:HK97 family phage major capsid protein
MDLKIKRAETLHKLSKLQAEYQNNKNGMPAEIAKEFSSMLDQVEQMTNEIRFNDYTKQDFSDHDATPTDGFTSVYNQNAAKKTLGEAFRMLASGERSKIDNNFLLELGQKNGLREYRTEYASDNIIETKLTNVFLELVKDDRFLSRIPTVTVKESYLKYPVVTRENFPVAEGKADADALTGSDTNFTSITLQPKNSYVLSRFHKDLIRDGGRRAYDAVWASCREAITKRLVNGILFGSGSNAGEFNGLDNVSGATIYDTSGGSIVDYSLITRGAKALNDRFVDHSEMVTLISPNTYQKFSNLRELSSSGMYLTPPDQINMIPLISNAQVKQNYNSDKTRLYMMRPESSILALFGNFEMELNERYAEFDHAAALIVFRSDFAFLDPEHLFIATNLPTA